MDTTFARRIRLFILKSFGLTLFMFTALTVSSAMFIGLYGYEGIYFAIFQVMVLIVLMISSYLWARTKEGSWDGFTHMAYFSEYLIASMCIYLILAIPTDILILIGLVPNKWFTHLGLSLFAATLSDLATKFGRSPDDHYF